MNKILIADDNQQITSIFSKLCPQRGFRAVGGSGWTAGAGAV
nr:hypothetical protein [uncultured Phascolarctobacterium sp.]